MNHPKSALVVFVDETEWTTYIAGKLTRNCISIIIILALFKLCRLDQDFHFLGLEEQFLTLESRIESKYYLQFIKMIFLYRIIRIYHLLTEFIIIKWIDQNVLIIFIF